jgi:hypothetical protein
MSGCLAFLTSANAHAPFTVAMTVRAAAPKAGLQCAGNVAEVMGGSVTGISKFGQEAARNGLKRLEAA